MVEEYVYDNNYAGLHANCYHCYGEIHFTCSFGLISAKSMNCKIWAKDSLLGQEVCLKSMSRTITMQEFMLTAITVSEKYTFVIASKQLDMGQGYSIRSRGVFEEYVKDNYDAGIHAYSYHCFREIHFCSSL